MAGSSWLVHGPRTRLSVLCVVSKSTRGDEGQSGQGQADSGTPTSTVTAAGMVKSARCDTVLRIGGANSCTPRSPEPREKTCLDCGAPIGRWGTRCRHCAARAQWKDPETRAKHLRVTQSAEYRRRQYHLWISMTTSADRA